MSTAAADAAPESDAVSGRTPPYVSYKTFLTLLEDLKTNGIPPQLDRSGLSRFSGGVVAQLLMALRSLGCLTEQAPTNRLRVLVQVCGTPEFSRYMQEALRVAYPFLSNMDLTTATPSMFADAFKVTGAKEDVLKKSRRFYLQAAADVGIQIGPRILKGPKSVSRPSNGSAPATPRRRQAPKKPSERADLGQGGDGARQPVATIEQQLIAKFPSFDPEWPDQIKAAWFDGFKNLMASTKDNGGDQK